MNLRELLTAAIRLLNENQGVLAVVLFLSTLLLGWASGLFRALRNKPNLKIQLIEYGPSFYSIVGTGKVRENYKCHRTCMALYLRVSNTGVSSTSVLRVRVGFRPHRPLVRRWRRYYLERNHALSDFQFMLGKSGITKFFPNLVQRSQVSGEQTNLYLERGASINGVVYFEGDECLGGFHPRGRKKRTRVKIVVTDAFGRRYCKKVWIPIKTLPEAREFNPHFGASRADRNETETQIELETDENGNLAFSEQSS